MTNIYVGNLSFDTTEQHLREVFEEFGQVAAVNLIIDRQSGNSRGFAFVEMSDAAAARAAILALNQHELDGRRIAVNEARPRPSRS